jgi:hypothetical protein
MRYHEIIRRPATTDAYPFTADITIAPDAFGEFERAMQQQDVRLLARLDRDHRCLVHIGCSSTTVRQAVRNCWR